MAPFLRAVAALAILRMSVSSKQVLLANTTLASLQSHTFMSRASPRINSTSDEQDRSVHDGFVHVCVAWQRRRSLLLMASVEQGTH